eukprot:917066-Pelagomonas_calceolata.AAC.10
MQNEPFETPMQPITMLRNALGREEGGSGVPIDKEAYNKWVTVTSFGAVPSKFLTSFLMVEGAHGYLSPLQLVAMEGIRFLGTLSTIDHVITKKRLFIAQFDQ